MWNAGLAASSSATSGGMAPSRASECCTGLRVVLGQHSDSDLLGSLQYAIGLAALQPLFESYSGMERKKTISMMVSVLQCLRSRNLLLRGSCGGMRSTRARGGSNRHWRKKGSTTAKEVEAVRMLDPGVNTGPQGESSSKLIKDSQAEVKPKFLKFVRVQATVAILNLNSSSPKSLRIPNSLCLATSRILASALIEFSKRRVWKWRLWTEIPSSNMAAGRSRAWASCGGIRSPDDRRCLQREKEGKFSRPPPPPCCPSPRLRVTTSPVAAEAGASLLSTATTAMLYFTPPPPPSPPRFPLPPLPDPLRPPPPERL
nr:hypothetical protein Iba_chr12fCG5900 [Ipomoea batatas]